MAGARLQHKDSGVASGLDSLYDNMTSKHVISTPFNLSCSGRKNYVRGRNTYLQHFLPIHLLFNACIFKHFFSEYFNYLHVVKTVNIDSSQNTEHERVKVHFYHHRLEGSCKAILGFACEWQVGQKPET
jgi:hypothetical protein